MKLNLDLEYNKPICYNITTRFTPGDKSANISKLNVSQHSILVETINNSVTNKKEEEKGKIKNTPC